MISAITCHRCECHLNKKLKLTAIADFQHTCQHATKNAKGPRVVACAVKGGRRLQSAGALEPPHGALRPMFVSPPPPMDLGACFANAKAKKTPATFTLPSSSLRSTSSSQARLPLVVLSPWRRRSSAPELNIKNMFVLFLCVHGLLSFLFRASRRSSTLFIALLPDTFALAACVLCCACVFLLVLLSPAIARCKRVRKRDLNCSRSDENKIEQTPTVGLEPTTTRLRALRSAD